MTKWLIAFCGRDSQGKLFFANAFVDTNREVLDKVDLDLISVKAETDLKKIHGEISNLVIVNISRLS